MKKFNIHKFFMGLIITVQILIGIFLIAVTFYLDDNVYMELESFFYNFLFSPGLVLIIMSFYYLLFRKFDKHSGFVYSGAIATFMITNTAEATVLFRARFPEGWFSYLPWIFLTDLIMTIIVALFNIFFVVAYRNSKRIKEIQ